ncbi:MAG: hypothetical protein NTU69_01105 [Proteobacteria bacterium]|nr:hypothetical protein [Pseudomonadota bacterium]
MAKHGGEFRSKKRQKELSRLQKQEEKRQRRFGGQTAKETGTVETVPEESKKDLE